MADYTSIDSCKVSKWLQEAQTAIDAYLKSQIGYYEGVSSFQSADSEDDAVLVVILNESCPYYAGKETRCEPMEEHVKKALLKDFFPFPQSPFHNLYTAFASFVVVKIDPTATSGFAAVSWPSFIRSPKGEFGDYEHRCRMLLPGGLTGEEEYHVTPLDSAAPKESASTGFYQQ